MKCLQTPEQQETDRQPIIIFEIEINSNEANRSAAEADEALGLD